MKKMISILFSLLLLSPLVFAAGQSDAAASDDGTTTIEFLQWWGTEGDVGASLEGLVADFEKENPNIKVKLISLPFGESKKTDCCQPCSGSHSRCCRSQSSLDKGIC